MSSCQGRRTVFPRYLALWNVSGNNTQYSSIDVRLSEISCSCEHYFKRAWILMLQFHDESLTRLDVSVSPSTSVVMKKLTRLEPDSIHTIWPSNTPSVKDKTYSVFPVCVTKPPDPASIKLGSPCWKTISIQSILWKTFKKIIYKVSLYRLMQKNHRYAKL